VTVPFRIPIDTLKALGRGDAAAGQGALCAVIGCYGHGVGIVPAEKVAEIGGGNMSNGRRVLRKFIAIAHRNHAAAIKQRIAKAYADGGAVDPNEYANVPGVG
jgi:hypothetical protein